MYHVNKNLNKSNITLKTRLNIKKKEIHTFLMPIIHIDCKIKKQNHLEVILEVNKKNVRGISLNVNNKSLFELCNNKIINSKIEIKSIKYVNLPPS